MRPLVFFGIVCAIFIASCHSNEQGLFSPVVAANSGIDFENKLTEKPGLNILYYLYYYNGAGVAAGDLNNDGLTDLYFSSNTKGANKLYLNKGDFIFEDITNTAGVAGIADWCTGVSMADVNGDGLLDIYVVAVAGDFGLVGRNALYINQGNLTFKEQAVKAGLGFSALGTQAAFFDYDRDGDLDCYLLNHSKRPHANLLPASNRLKPDSINGDKLLRNTLTESGQLKFEEVSGEAGIYRSTLGYGLGISVADFNNDGWDDIYIGNDFHENDYFYLNNGNGTFSEKGRDFFGHFSRFSMGNDAADMNNDGNIDLITVDMLPPDERTLKTYGSDENLNSYLTKIVANGYGHQVSRNCIQRNLGKGGFSDVALMGDAAATDWSWCPLSADFDNDGLTDLFISSGIVKRPVDLDYVMYVSALSQQKGMDMTDAYDAEAIAKMPDGATHPFFFKGDGKFGFKDVSGDWGTGKMKGYFNGSAYADLDNDGDLDMVINCINAKAALLKNNSVGKQYLRVKFEGDNRNTKGIGAKAYLFINGSTQFLQLMPTRGFQSASEPVLHFGLGDSAVVDSLLIVWPDQRFQVIAKPAISKILQVKQKEGSGSFNYNSLQKEAPPPFEDITSAAGIKWAHQENEFIDFNRQYLIPHMQSTRGPKIAVADVNGDGLEDFYVCGAMNHPGQLMQQTPDGKFVQGYGTVFAQYASSEEIDALFFDADGDGDKDLYVASGGYQLDNGEAALNDHLYFNDGKGIFSERKDALPYLYSNKSCVAVSDIDADNDPDLFVGSLASAGRYGFYQPSYFLINDGKGNMSLSKALPQDENETGMITCALFTDINNDNLPDLVVAGEWMPVTMYINQKSTWKKETIPESSGLWQTLSLADVNNDGKQDILAGNWGLNSKLACGKDGPLKMYVHDFDKNGREEQIVAYTMKGKEYTFLAKDELERALPVLKRGYLTYNEVAGETVQYMFYDLFKDYREWKAETLASLAFINNGNGAYTKQLLPYEWQLSPVFSLTSAPDGKTITAGGNFYGVIPYEGRYDAMLVSTFRFGSDAAKPTFAGNMPRIIGEVRDAKWITVNKEKAMLVARNNLPLMLLKPAIKQ
jgi:hypothetical protein